MSEVLLIGDQGAMGRRYSAILKHLMVPFTGVDIYGLEGIKEKIIAHPKIIIATPTNTHLSVLNLINQVCVSDPIRRIVLCEKPVVTSKEDLDELEKINDDLVFHLYCVNQYAYLPKIKELSGGYHGLKTYYNYYNTGKDGLHWDTFQIHALATREPEVYGFSPFWNCVINGVECRLTDMDFAYIEMIKDFLDKRERSWGFDVIKKTTEKILKICERSL